MTEECRGIDSAAEPGLSVRVGRKLRRRHRPRQRFATVVECSRMVEDDREPGRRRRWETCAGARVWTRLTIACSVVLACSGPAPQGPTWPGPDPVEPDPSSPGCSWAERELDPDEAVEGWPSPQELATTVLAGTYAGRIEWAEAERRRNTPIELIRSTGAPGRRQDHDHRGPGRRDLPVDDRPGVSRRSVPLVGLQ